MEAAWTCPSCGRANSAAQRRCPSCGRDRAVEGGAGRGGAADPLARRLAAGALLVLALTLAGVAVVRLTGATAGTGDDAASPAAAPVAAAEPTPTPTPTPAQTARPTPTPTPTPSLVSAYPRVASGVVQIIASDCEQPIGTGTGFLVGPDLVATVAHVVDGAAEVGLRLGMTSAGAGGEAVEGEVIGVDPSRELALIQTTDLIDAHIFEIAPPPAVGEPVGLLGFPDGGPLSMTSGTVTGLGREAVVDGWTLSGLVQTDAAVNPGNSGGPLIDVAGRAVGLADLRPEVVGDGRRAEGIGLAVPAIDAVDVFDAWARRPEPPESPPCEGLVLVADGVDADAVADVTETLTRYFEGINTADYADAFDQLTPAAQERSDFASFAEGVASSIDVGIVVRDWRPSADGGVAHVTFRSLQDAADGPRPGETCTDWSLDYRMRWVGDRLLIDGTDPHGDERSQPCPDETGPDEPGEG